jgi:lysyl-tRNA synthetase class 2
VTEQQAAPPEGVLQEQRKQKLRQLRELGLPFHPRRFDRTHTSLALQMGFDQLEGQHVAVAGRLVADNRMGKAAFVRLADSAGRIQAYIRRDLVSDALWDYYRLLDRGDWVGVRGLLFRTKTGEVTVEARDIVLLQKAYLPLPEKFHGLQDVETRYRQRYVDLIANERSREVALKRAKMITAIRQYLDSRGFIEVETPTLQPLYGGGAARPFMTHSEYFDMDLYLRIADELYLKRLVVGGFERVYEIGKDFRNESFSKKHSQEFTMLELYQAFADYTDMMKLMEEMVASAAQEIESSLTVQFGEHTLDLTLPWKRQSFHDAVREYAGLDLQTTGQLRELLDFGRTNGVFVTPEMSRGGLMDQIWSSMVEPKLIQPTFIHDYPIDFPGSTFARAREGRADIVERFEAFMGGMELANAFTELNDPFAQEDRVRALQQSHGIKLESDVVDRDYITALEYGLPPTGGLGIGMDRLAMVLTDSDHIRETILFPLLRQAD